MVKITTQKVSEKETLELYSDLIAPEITELEKSKAKAKDKKSNILNVLKNLQSVFTGVYLNYSDKPPESEESIAERTKLRRQRSDETAKKEKMIDPKLFREYFEYLSPSDIYKNLNKATSSGKKSKPQVNTMKDRLLNLMEEFKSNPTSDARKIKNRYNVLTIVNLFSSLIN